MKCIIQMFVIQILMLVYYKSPLGQIAPKLLGHLKMPEWIR